MDGTGVWDWQLGDGFRFKVAVEPWPVRRDRPTLLMFTNGPRWERVRCFLVGNPEIIRDPESGQLHLNLDEELPLVEVDPPDLYHRVAKVRLPLDRDKVTLAFDVCWGGGYYTLEDEVYTCYPVCLPIPAQDDPDPDPFLW